MSKIGKNPISITQGVDVKVQDNLVTVTGPKGSLDFTVSQGISVEVKDGFVVVTCDSEEIRNLRGTTRAIIANMIQGVAVGYTKTLQVIGVGFDASQKGDKIQFKLGFSHLVFFPVPANVDVEISKDPKGNSLVKLSSHDKQLLGQTAAKIRDLKRPEPYKGKGIRYLGEVIKMKAGKTAKK